MFKTVYTDEAPKPVGPYSQALRVGPWLFCSGQIPLDPKSSELVGESIEIQTKQVFENIKAVLLAENMTFQNVIKTLVFLTDLKNFSSFNRIYESYFANHKPARSCVEVSALPKLVKVEMELIACESGAKLLA